MAEKDFIWTEECEAAFERIKEQLGTPPLLAKPLEGETLILYLAVSEYAVSAVLVREEGDSQHPIYYISKRLPDVENRYTSMEKLVFALVLAARKLRPYFQAHRIEVRTSYPLRSIMHKPEATGRMLKWAVELGQFDLEYKPRVAVKGQALADFITEFSGDEPNEERSMVPFQPPPKKRRYEKWEEEELWWSLHVDGMVNNKGAEVGMVLVSPEGHRLASVIPLDFPP